MIKFVLNHIPRPVLQKIAGWTMPVARLFYAVGRGRNADGGSGYAENRVVECPICGGRYRRFMPYGYVEVRKNALCPRCLSLERHRLLWLWLNRESDMPSLSGKSANAKSISPEPAQLSPLSIFNFQFSTFLHIAPEVCLSKKFEKLFPSGNYVTADLESPLANVKMDVQAIPFPDDSFGTVFCNHVLEHVADDRLAMREMHRVMRRGGWGVMLSPVDETRAETFEDDTITDPAERTRIFGQYDHRRIYGRDYADRLRAAGFEVAEINYFDVLTPAEQTLYALRREILYIVRK